MTLDKVARLLQTRGLALGLDIPQIRRHYPAASVRRQAIVASLRHFEDLGVVHVHHGRYRWVGPLNFEVRPFGLDTRRLTRDGARTPVERVELGISLSNAFAHERTRVRGLAERRE